jgi:hypothetical protein
MIAETKELTSEQRLGIIAPPEHQCSEIDKIIKAIRYCTKLADKADRLDEEDAKSALNDISSELWNFERDIEDIRKACEGLREWGQAWKDLCKSVALEKDIDLQDFA